MAGDISQTHKPRGVFVEWNSTLARYLKNYKYYSTLDKYPKVLLLLHTHYISKIIDKIFGSLKYSM
jgi:hypothetical protein